MSSATAPSRDACTEAGLFCARARSAQFLGRSVFFEVRSSGFLLISVISVYLVAARCLGTASAVALSIYTHMDFGTWSKSTLTPGSRDASTTNGGNGAWVTFADARSVIVKVGLSYTGVAGARANLAAETGSGFDFDATRAALQQRWEDTLGRATISGGTHDRQVAYYTSLYHSMLHPNLAGDVDGALLRLGRRIHAATDYTPRQNFSLWDTTSAEPAARDTATASGPR